jgi:hypothetical protein
MTGFGGEQPGRFQAREGDSGHLFMDGMTTPTEESQSFTKTTAKARMRQKQSFV